VISTCGSGFLGDGGPRSPGAGNRTTCPDLPRRPNLHRVRLRGRSVPIRKEGDFRYPVLTETTPPSTRTRATAKEATSGVSRGLTYRATLPAPPAGPDPRRGQSPSRPTKLRGSWAGAYPKRPFSIYPSSNARRTTRERKGRSLPSPASGRRVAGQFGKPPLLQRRCWMASHRVLGRVKRIRESPARPIDATAGERPTERRGTLGPPGSRLRWVAATPRAHAARSQAWHRQRQHPYPDRNRAGGIRGQAISTARIQRGAVVKLSAAQFAGIGFEVQVPDNVTVAFRPSVSGTRSSAVRRRVLYVEESTRYAHANHDGPRRKQRPKRKARIPLFHDHPGPSTDTDFPLQGRQGARWKRLHSPLRLPNHPIPGATAPGEGGRTRAGKPEERKPPSAASR